VDLVQRRDQLRARFAELQWDLGGLAYEMAIRDHIRLEVLVRHAAQLQDVDAELGEVERILHGLRRAAQRRSRVLLAVRAAAAAASFQPRDRRRAALAPSPPGQPAFARLFWLAGTHRQLRPPSRRTGPRPIVIGS